MHNMSAKQIEYAIDYFHGYFTLAKSFKFFVEVFDEHF
jgi:hypothetical protein